MRGWGSSYPHLIDVKTEVSPDWAPVQCHTTREEEADPGLFAFEVQGSIYPEELPPSLGWRDSVRLPRRPSNLKRSLELASSGWPGPLGTLACRAEACIFLYTFLGVKSGDPGSRHQPSRSPEGISIHNKPQRSFVWEGAFYLLPREGERAPAFMETTWVPSGDALLLAGL